MRITYNPAGGDRARETLTDLSLSDRNRGPLLTRLYLFLGRFYPILVPCAFFLLDWAGLWPNSSSYSRRRLLGSPRRLADIWWHLPAYLALTFVYVWLGRQRRTGQKATADDDDRDKPIRPDRQRFRFYQIALPCALFLFDWAGINVLEYPSLPLFRGPRPLADVWWHLPAYLAVAFVVFGRRRQQRARREAVENGDDADKPITLGL